MASCSSSQNASSIAAVNSMMNSSMDPPLSSTVLVFAGANIGSISDCTFQIFHGNVKIVQAEKNATTMIDCSSRKSVFLCSNLSLVSKFG